MLKLSIYRSSLLFLGLFLFQTAYTQSIRVGVRAGVLLAKLHIDPQEDDAADYKNVLIPQFAIPIEIGFGSMFAIQPEIMYGSHGTKSDDNLNTTSGGVTTVGYAKANLQIQTLEIPLLAKVKFGSENFKIHLLAGPSLGFGLSGKAKNDYAFRITDQNGNVLANQSGKINDTVVFVKDNYKSSDVEEDELGISKTNFNLHFGAGLNLNVGKTTLFLDGRYLLGLNDLAPEEENTPNSDKITVKSRRIGISAGILFPL